MTLVPMRTFGWFLGSISIASGASAGACVPQVDDCWAGLAVGEHIELRIVDTPVLPNWTQDGDLVQPAMGWM
jgi:hypothetical protein